VDPRQLERLAGLGDRGILPNEEFKPRRQRSSPTWKTDRKSKAAGIAYPRAAPEPPVRAVTTAIRTLGSETRGDGSRPGCGPVRGCAQCRSAPRRPGITSSWLPGRPLTGREPPGCEMVGTSVRGRRQG
jgi:hypothetical protein